MLTPLYDQKSRVKLLVLVLALLVGVVTMLYTKRLIQRLSEREQQQIDLYAKTLRYIITSEESSNMPFLLEQIINANTTIPVILTDGENIVDTRNLGLSPNLAPADSVRQIRALLLAM
jgi:C4-dicarboxylate-specific signal transduction histidine kinase